MPRHAVVLTLLVPLLVSLLAPAALAQPDHQEHTFSRTITQEQTLDYLLHLPQRYDPDGEPVPLLIFLHGAGERGNDLERVKFHGPPKMIEQGHDFPAIVLSPQCPDDAWWTEHIDALLALIDQVIAEHHVDPSRIYITGLSMGGYGTWALGAAMHDRAAAIIPICGGGQYWDARRLGPSGVKIWAFHGDKDGAVPLEETTRMISVVRLKGNADARLTVYPGTGHDAWTPTYDNPDVWEWLFAQKREDAATE